MIERINPSDDKDYGWLVEFCNNNFNYDFYFTEDNSRIYVTDDISLKNFMKQSECIYSLKHRGDYVGFGAIWKSIGGGKKRYYVKLNATTAKFAKEVLTVMLWNTTKDLYVKVRKNSTLLSVFKEKGFRFMGGRGIQVLLKRKYIQLEKKFIEKDKEDVQHKRD